MNSIKINVPYVYVALTKINTNFKYLIFLLVPKSNNEGSEEAITVTQEDEIISSKKTIHFTMH